MNSANPASERMQPEHSVSTLGLWFGVMGGAVAWTLHLLLAYGIAEFGCVSPFREVQFLGISGVAWLEGLVTVVMLGIAVLASVVAKRNGEAIAGLDIDTQWEPHDERMFMARSGVLANRLFIFIIAVQSLPILFYLREC